MLRRTLIRLAPPTLAIATWAGTVLAQSTPKVEKVLKPPTPPVGKAETPWLPIILAFLLVAIIVGVNFIPSKRGHLD
jgi:hypothetical protein